MGNVKKYDREEQGGGGGGVAAWKTVLNNRVHKVRKYDGSLLFNYLVREVVFCYVGSLLSNTTLSREFRRFSSWVTRQRVSAVCGYFL